MKIVRINYPCVGCGRFLDPEEKFCPSCRRHQENINFKRHFNLFYRPDGKDILSVVFKGHILTEKDMRKQLLGISFVSGRDYFVGTYRLNDITKIPHSSDERYQFMTFQPVHNGEFGPDTGACSLQVTTFEI